MINHYEHEFVHDVSLHFPDFMPDECTYTYPDGMLCGYREDEHPLTPEKEHTGN